MTAIVRIPRKLYLETLSDLKRPHPFAAERVGFLFARAGSGGPEGPIVLLYRYFPVPDDFYIDDPRAGARIGSDAIRAVLQQVLDRGDGAFHVHLHEHSGRPAMSRMDHRELPRLVPSFRAAGPGSPHGIVIFSEDDGLARVWPPGKAEPVRAAHVVVVGRPIEIWEVE